MFTGNWPGRPLPPLPCPLPLIWTGRGAGEPGGKQGGLVQPQRTAGSSWAAPSWGLGGGPSCGPAVLALIVKCDMEWVPVAGLQGLHDVPRAFSLSFSGRKVDFRWDCLLSVCPPHLDGRARTGTMWSSWQMAWDSLFSWVSPPCRVTGSQMSRRPEGILSPKKMIQG